MKSISSAKSAFSFFQLQNQCRTTLFQSSILYFSSTTQTQTRLFPEEINIIYDGKCNICKLEMDFLAKRDAQKINVGAPKLKLTDIECDTYNENDPANGGVSYKEGMMAIHAVTSDGRVIKGVPVFLLAYEQVNLGWLFQVTTWPVVKQIVELGYVLFAKYRTNVTRGATIDSLVEQYEARKELRKMMDDTSCDSGRCQTKIQ
jgi:predicted DCC family thiol-disulfide oxidoreductase YuxK